MITIRIEGPDRLRASLGRFAGQLPFAAARAVTEVAKRVQASETALLPQLLDRPTPFTLRTYAVRGATKASPTAIVYARPIQAAYLAPEEFGLPQKVAKSAVLMPVDAALNQFGNIPRGAVARWRGRKDVFVGTVHGVSGIWQRVKKPHGLKLLVRFRSPVVPHVRLGFRERALRQVRELIGPELQRQIAIAIRTAR